ncbi:hypothetical protein DPMN_031133 [Dreissena polymorpha]|uniref:Uncharacterized protein n=1 Tax=Dreissena polymorpha TaxID=45954 RepID=A0A9D4LZE7_DREPO|nr:hypothetical protein DPMN_031133 [Dreissena polymorpha]
MIGTNLLTKFHEDQTINVASRVFTNKCGRTNRRRTTDKDRKTALSPWQQFLTKFHENWAKNGTSRVLTCFHYIHIEKNAQPTGSHVFSLIWTIFELVPEINKTNVLTNFHDDWAKIVTSRVLTRKTALPTGGHVFQRTGTTFELLKIGHEIFELNRDFIGTKLLTKFHEDQPINVASRVFTNNCKRTDGRRTKTVHKSSPEQSGELKTVIGLMTDRSHTQIYDNKYRFKLPSVSNRCPTYGIQTIIVKL